MFNAYYFCPLGLKITVDPSKPGGERVSSILVKNRLISHRGQYVPIQDSEKYRVILSEYTWEGGDGFDFDNEAQKFVSIGKYYCLLVCIMPLKKHQFV